MTCPGKRTHICIQCGTEYKCYACNSDTLNAEYYENMCQRCLFPQDYKEIK